MICSLRPVGKWNPFTQSEHTCGFSPVCSIICVLSPCFMMKPLPQTEHWCGFSPVWVIMCGCKTLITQWTAVRFFSYVGHHVSLYFSLSTTCCTTVSTLMWFVSHHVFLKASWQMKCFNKWNPLTQSINGHIYALPRLHELGLHL